MTEEPHIRPCARSRRSFAALPIRSWAVIAAAFLLTYFLAVPASRAQDELGVVDSVNTVQCHGSVTGATCYALKVTCPEVEDYTAYLKVVKPSSLAGLVVLGTGGLGIGLFEDATYGPVTIQNLLSAGYTVAEISFGSPFVTKTVQPVQGWQVDTNGVGMRKAACRYATIANWIKQNWTPSQPLCASGNSAGAAVIGYGLAHYGLDTVLSYALLTSGPPFSRLDYACDNSQPRTLEYCTNLQRGMSVGSVNAKEFVDPAYQPTYAAACSQSIINHSKTLDGIFLPDSISSPDANTNYAITVGFLYGAQDIEGTAINQAEQYRNSISSPTTRACITDAPHTIPNALDGAQAIASELISNCH